MLNAIHWPENYLPGHTDNFVSNEVIVSNLSVQDIWPFLVNAHLWPSYYGNSSDIDLNGAECLEPNLVFFFKTFGFPVNAQVLSMPRLKIINPLESHGMAGQVNQIVVIAWMSTMLG